MHVMWNAYCCSLSNTIRSKIQRMLCEYMAKLNHPHLFLAQEDFSRVYFFFTLGMYNRTWHGFNKQRCTSQRVTMRCRTGRVWWKHSLAACLNGNAGYKASVGNGMEEKWSSWLLIVYFIEMTLVLQFKLWEMSDVRETKGSMPPLPDLCCLHCHKQCKNSPVPVTFGFCHPLADSLFRVVCKNLSLCVNASNEILAWCTCFVCAYIRVYILRCFGKVLFYLILSWVWAGKLTSGKSFIFLNITMVNVEKVNQRFAHYIAHDGC